MRAVGAAGTNLTSNVLERVTPAKRVGNHRTTSSKLGNWQSNADAPGEYVTWNAEGWNIHARVAAPKDGYFCLIIRNRYSV